MESSGNKEPLSMGEQKINEYVGRIKSGESKDSILQGLPESFKSGIEKGLAEPVEEETEEIVNKTPPQYKGLDSETLDFIWTIPEYLDPEKTKELKDRKLAVLSPLRLKESQERIRNERRQVDQKKIEELKTQLGITKPTENAVSAEQRPAVLSVDEETPLLSIEERKKLQGWTASYELAKVAKQEGVDLSKISREDYVNFAIQNSLAIDDNQLRAATWQRMGTSVHEIILASREKTAQIKEETERAFAKFSYNIKKKAGEENRFLSENIRVRQGTKTSSSWLFFGINSGTAENTKETYKSYVSLKDLNTLTPERFTQFMVALRDEKYNGDVKIFQDLSEQGVRLNDQIVMHGGSQSDAELALQVAEKFFGTDLDQKSVGKDGVIDGKNKSYSEILAKKISDAVNPPIEKS